MKKEFLLGNKAKDLYLYTKQITKPVPDDRVEARDVRRMLRQIASAKTPEQMVELLKRTEEAMKSRKDRPRFPKSETFDLLADIQETTKAILKGVHSANETNFEADSEIRLRLIQETINDCNLLLKFIEISLELGYIDIKRSAAWTKYTTDVKYMALAWLKKDRDRHQKAQERKD